MGMHSMATQFMRVVEAVANADDLAAAMTAREMGKIPEKRCGAGMTPGTALDLDKLQKRLERVGYVFSICEPPSTEEIQKATEEMALLPTK